MLNIDLKPRDDTPKSLFNPLKDNFVTEIRDDNNIPQTYTIPSMEIATFPAYLAERIEKDLITTIKNERKLTIITPDKENEIRKEIELENR